MARRPSLVSTEKDELGFAPTIGLSSLLLCFLGLEFSVDELDVQFSFIGAPDILFEE